MGKLLEASGRGLEGVGGGLREAEPPPRSCFVPPTQTSSEIVRTMLRMSEVTTASGAPYTQPLSSNEVRDPPLWSPPALLTILL